MALTQITTRQIKNFPIVSVKDFGAVGDGVADDTVAIQAAIDYSQTANKILTVDAGTYKITATLTTSSTKPLDLRGEGFGPGTNEVGTVFKFYTPADTLFYIRTGNTAKQSLSNFMCVNASGGTTEIAMDVAGAFISITSVSLYSFQYGIKGSSTLYCSFADL